MGEQSIKPLSIFLALVFFVSLGLNGFFIVTFYENNRVVAVIDGDSLELKDGRRVRLLGIDAPEKGRCMYAQAKARLTERTVGRHVRLKDTVKDGYGRIVANVIIDAPFNEWMGYLTARFVRHESYYPTAFINGLMVEDGLAKYNGVSSPYREWLKRVHTQAKKEKKGIYSPDCEQMVAPHPECSIKGNIRNDQKTYHFPGCDNYDQTMIDLSFGDQWFCSEDEATQAGFLKATGCR